MKYVKKTGLLLFWMMLGLILGLLINTFAVQVYELLFEHFPEAFPLYNPVFEKAEYEAFILTVAYVSVSAMFLLTVYICQRFNNDRFEYVITKTDGLYKIPEILKTYVSKFALSDFISSVITALFFTVPIYFIPRQFFTASSFAVDLLTPLRTIVEGSGIWFAAVYAIFAIIAAHAVTLPLVLKFYRAKWLTGFAEGTI